MVWSLFVMKLMGKKCFKKPILMALLISMVVGSLSCTKKEVVIKSPNVIIRKSGTYYVAGIDVHMKVWIEDNIVHYRVIKANNNVIESPEKPSAAQNWFFCWDDRGRLWFNSSDI